MTFISKTAATPSFGLLGRVCGLAAAAGVALSLAACASTGVRVDEQTVSRFEKGKTTYAEVIQALGQPTSSMIGANGQRTIMYTYAHAQARAATFIPVVGMFAGGMDVNSTNAVLTFDEKGLLLSYSSSNSQLGAGTGIVSGVQQGSPQTAPKQPRAAKP